MASYGDEKYCGGYTRSFYDGKWDLITSDDGDLYWRDKITHRTFRCKGELSDKLTTNQIGKEVEFCDDEDEDKIWEEEEF